ncbi:copper resistance CopC family protein [Demequina salsinemoris]|uniref:copper resistance CopC family protein n=1 Tax=Demequina salsinemoris TaxID=577470 RepID=UPI000AC0D9BE|nr:copper resistance protein CopC [Demequina salsinemoris]
MRTSLLRSALALTLALVVMLPGGAAYAHTALVSTDPEDGAELSSLDEVTLEFSGVVLDLGTTLALVQGDERIELEPEFPSETTVTAAVSDLAPGQWSLVFRVVAEDGHPLEGQVDFTLVGTEATDDGTTDDGTTSEPTATAASSPSATSEEGASSVSASPTPIAAEISATAEPSPNPTVMPAEEADATGGWARLLGVAVLIAVAAVAIVWARRRGDGEDGDDEGADGDDAGAEPGAR